MGRNGASTIMAICRLVEYELEENSHLCSEDIAQNGGMPHKNLAVQSHTAWR